ncbi:MAG: cytochrome C oxidase subunit IV family protein [Phycisphaerae bacterium]
MTAHSAEDIAKEVRIYISVFAALMVLTVITVAVSYLGLSIGTAVLVALLIATIKGSLVACCFMHLISEKKIIYWVLGITILFFVALMLVPVLDVQFNVADTDV